MMSGHSVTQWIEQLKAGEQSLAAERLWDRYFQQLVAVARDRLSGAASPVVDGEDVAVSVFSSLCLGASKGKFAKLLDRDNLWSLLVAMTILKSRERIRHERRQKRGGGMIVNQISPGSNDSVADCMADAISREPSPEFAVAMAEQCGRLLDGLEPEQRQIANRKLQGYTNSEIAVELGCGVRTVERRLSIIRLTWEKLDD